MQAATMRNTPDRFCSSSAPLKETRTPFGTACVPTQDFSFATSALALIPGLTFARI
jgi:hypothetical protein